MSISDNEEFDDTFLTCITIRGQKEKEKQKEKQQQKKRTASHRLHVSKNIQRK